MCRFIATPLLRCMKVLERAPFCSFRVASVRGADQVAYLSTSGRTFLVNLFVAATRMTMRKLALAGWLLMSTGVYAQGVLAPSQAEAGPRNSLASAATAVGMRQCLPALTALSALGVQGATNNDVLFDWDRTRAGNSTVFSLIGLELPNSNAAMSITGVPEADGSCTVSAERISVAPGSCQVVARKELVGYQATRLLSHMMVYTDTKDPGSSVSLIDAQAGCLVIRRYVKFSAGAAALGK
jgi:hypothetical protein